ncbi:MAG: ABC transporter ATP-binding protein [Solirubrobacteraceae bacterium]|nr:ABC transporter ATP-binding protein [Solirubrobacteraceae bacterium]
MSEPLLSLRAVVKRFGEVDAVAGVDLDVPRGAFLTLLGPSGSGKTTCLNMIAGFERPDAGEIVLGGERINELPPHRRQLNTVFQGYALFPHLNVGDNVAFGLRMKRTPKDEIRARVAEALETVQMAPMADRPVDKLSGGQQQRVALARALVNRPQLVLLDEPLSALDAQLRKSMQVELKRIQEAVGLTFVYVTHDQEEALVMSDLVCVMNAGRIVQLGPPDELYHRPVSRFVAGFIGRNNFLTGDLVHDGGRVYLALGDGVRLPLEDAAQPPGPVVVAVRPERLAITDSAADDTLAATVRGTRFLGDRVEADVELECGGTLSLFVNGRPVETAERVYVRVPAGHCSILRADDHGRP